MEALETIASAAPVLALVPFQQFPIDFMIFKYKCPVQNQNGLALSEIKFLACYNIS